MPELKDSRRELFCKQYICGANQMQAAIRAGYSAKSARSISSRLMENDNVRTRIAELMDEKDAKLIATGDEVLRYLTAVMRGEYPDGEKVTDDIAMSPGCGDGLARTEHTSVWVDTRNRTRAAELLGKRHALFTDKVQMAMEPITIVDDVPGREGESPTSCDKRSVQQRTRDQALRRARAAKEGRTQ